MILSKKLFLLFCVVASISFVASCTNDSIDPNNCFSKSSLEDTPWVKEQLQHFQDPRSGPLMVGVYLYKGEYFIVFANPFMASPMNYIFDCSGDKSVDLNMGTYNQFYDQAKLIEVLLEETY